MIYLDTSAAMKLVRAERHTHDLRAWLAGHDGPLVSSVLIGVELVRATRRSCPDRLGRAGEVLTTVTTMAVSFEVIAGAAGYADPVLRSLDAVHLATAERFAAVLGAPLAGVPRL